LSFVANLFDWRQCSAIIHARNADFELRMSMTHTSECYVCGSKSIGLSGSKNGFAVYKCRDCELLWVPSNDSFVPIQDTELHSFYDHHYYSSASIIGYKDYLRTEVVHRVNANGILDVASKFVNLKAARVIDVGCAFGFLLDEARMRGADVYGVEVSQHAREHAVQTLGLRLVSELPSAGVPGNSFDAAFLIGTIEHLSDPRKAIADIHGCLKKGGIFVITTIDTKGLFPLYAIKPPEHLFYFSHANLERLLMQSGYEFLFRKTYFANYLLYDLFHRLAEFFGLPLLKRLSGWVERRFPVWRIRIPTNEMIIVARKA
jgi:SAM-dependent methyltransferase